jgi:hypothetical protein
MSTVEVTEVKEFGYTREVWEKNAQIVKPSFFVQRREIPKNEQTMALEKKFREWVELSQKEVQLERVRSSASYLKLTFRETLSIIWLFTFTYISNLYETCTGNRRRSR